MPKLTAGQAKIAESSRDFPYRELSVTDEDGTPYEGPNAEWGEQ